MPNLTDISAEILTWSKDRVDWQRDALRRLLSAGEISQADLEELVQLCKAGRGLADPVSSTPLSEEHLATKGVGANATSLISLTHHRGANALAAEQTITFGPSLTIAYGQNAAGKSGYTRILKQVCRSRSSQKIFGNLLSGEAPITLKATIRFHQGVVEESTEWTTGSPPNDALASVSVFDSDCAPVYLRDKTDVAFRPFGLDIFDRLANICVEVRSRLEAEKARLNALAPILPTLPEGTRARSLVGNLSSLTNPDQVRALATLSANERRRLDELRAQRSDLQAANPKQRAQELRVKADRVKLIRQHVAHLFALFCGSALVQLGTTVETLHAAQTSLETLRRAALTSDLLPGTGSETWRTMWDAAQYFSEIAYPQGAFPVLEEGARCLFCQQEIGVEANARLQHFAEYVQSTAQTQVRQAESAYEISLSSVRRAAIRRQEIELAVEELKLENSQLALEVETFLKTAEGIQRGIEEALALGVGFLAGMSNSPESALQAATLALQERAKQLLTEQPAMTPEGIAELKELEARLELGNHLARILEEIERKKRLAAYDGCLSDTTTQAITRKSTELTTRLVTDQLKAGFQEELRDLEFDHLAVAIQPAGGTKGALFHRLAFTNAPGVSITQVLSEGESRTLSLASFLTELKTAESRSTIIFDDPVSSLDHMWRKRIARRLVVEAEKRQVIVFTHDILFLRALTDEAARRTIDCKHQYIQRDVQVGICSEDLPWIAMNTKARIGRLRVRLQEAEAIFRNSYDKYEEAARGVYRLLREAWEQATTEVLLNDVVQRYRPSIETQKVKSLYDITQEDCKAVADGMTESSRWLHDQAAADATPFPKPEVLKQQIDELDSFVKTIHKRRE